MSNLTVTYVSPPPVPGSAVAAAPALTDAAADPLGFLAALLEQVQAALPSAAAPAEGADVAELQQRLTTLGTALAGTEWGDRFTDLAAELLDLAETDKDPETAADPLAVDPSASLADIVRILLGRPAGEAASPEAAGRQQAIVALLDSLGIAAPDNGPADATPTAPNADVPDDMLRLSTQLSRIGAALAERQPELAARLDSLATSLVASDAEPDLLARVSSAVTAADPKTLDALVKALAAPPPAATPPTATPGLAANVTLDLPDPLRGAAPPQPAGTPSDTATPRLAFTDAKSARAAPDTDGEPPAEPQKAAATPARTEAMPTTPAATPAAHVAGARALPAAYQTPAQPINMGQVAFELARQVQQGTSRFTIRLDPPELGRVDVKLQVDAGGGVSARLSVDRAETLDLFQRDQRTLERALAQAGLDPARTSLEFSLRQNPGQSGGQPQQHQQQHDWFSADGGGRAEPAADAPAPVLTLYRGTAGPAGVNLFV